MARRTAIGLDIGSTAVRAAEVRLGGAGAELVHFGQVMLPAGAVHDGEIIDSASVVAALKSLWSGGKFRSRNVVLGVASQRVIARTTELPWMPVDELRKSLPLLVGDMLPMPVDTAVLDFVPIEEQVKDSGDRVFVGLLIAAGRETVEALIGTVKAAGLSVHAVDLTSFALLRSVGTLVPGAPPEAVVDVGAEFTNVVVHQGGVPGFVRILAMGGATVTAAVGRAMSLPAGQSEMLKRSVLAMPGDDGEAVRARAAVADGVRLLVDEIRGSLDYCVATGASGPVARIVLSGGGSATAGLAERLALVTRAEVVVGRTFGAVRVGGTGLSDQQLAFVEPMACVPVGLALGASS